MAFIDLDHNSTTPLLPEAAEAMRAVPEGNPSSAHSAGRRARQALEDARERIAALLGADSDEVVFTSGATEANNLAVLGFLPSPRFRGEGGGASPPGEGRASDDNPSPPAPLPEAGRGEKIPLAIASRLEHPCVMEPLRQLEARGFAVEWLPVDARGVIRFTAPAPDTRLICLMLANHETGAVQPVRDVTRSLPGVALHCDAAQAVGKIPVNFHELGATTLAASAHKFGGPKGVGALIVKRGTKLHPLLFGGHQQQGRRPGTEAVALAVGMAAALELGVRNMAANRVRLEALRARFWTRLNDVAAPVVLNGPEIGAVDGTPTTLNVSFPGCRADLLLMALDLAGVACSTGSACSSGSLLPSPVLRAMGVPDEILRSALRFSFGPSTAFADLDEAAARIGRAVNQARASPL
jgi:cysteine desulfurase